MARRARKRNRRAVDRAARGGFRSVIQNPKFRIQNSAIALPFLRAVRSPKYPRRLRHHGRRRSRQRPRHAALQAVARGKNVARPFLVAPVTRILAARTFGKPLAHPAKTHPAIVGARSRSAPAPRRAPVAEYFLVGRTENLFAKRTRLRAEGQRFLAGGVGQPRRHRRQRRAAARVGRRDRSCARGLRAPPACAHAFRALTHRRASVL